ncbi:hypothetical protein LTR10_006831 [Elasticomyces elasticus]|nr:hypothetical protein LTR10_006831 [Elasticomyces elasticus]KAK4972766.1 hypothetical protein LTR42_006060 [Elasticomyces elasticus]KAK5728881.1 hypothetical protein LTR15_002022 [Elasticomyces elasticus]
MSRNVVQISERDSKIIRELDGETEDWKRKYEAVVATQADSAGLQDELRKRDEEIVMLKGKLDAALHDVSTLRLRKDMADYLDGRAEHAVLRRYRGPCGRLFHP